MNPIFNQVWWDPKIYGKLSGKHVFWFHYDYQYRSTFILDLIFMYSPF